MAAILVAMQFLCTVYLSGNSHHDGALPGYRPAFGWVHTCHDISYYSGSSSRHLALRCSLNSPKCHSQTILSILLMRSLLILLLSLTIASAQNIQTPVPEGDIGSIPLCVINLRNNDSRPATWSDLKTFLGSDDSNQHKYVENEYDCKHFSLELFRRAQLQGIACLLIIVNFSDNKDPHALVEFPTTDKGSVYVDFTPITSGATQGPSKSINYIAAGQDRIQVPLAQIPAEFTNNTAFFVGYLNKQDELKKARELITDATVNLSDLEQNLQHQKTLNKTKTVLRRIDLLRADIEVKTKQLTEAQRVYRAYAAKALSPFSTDAAGRIVFITRY